MTIDKIIETANHKLSHFMEKYQPVFRANHHKVLQAFKDCKVTEECFKGSTGYGYNDYGREVLNNLYAQIFCGEKAIVSAHFASGTHTIYTALQGILKSNSKVLSITGTPYDTLKEAFGHPRSFFENQKISHEVADLKTDDGTIDFNYLSTLDLTSYDAFLLQRSKGYATRPALTITAIKEAVEFLRQHNSRAIIFLDNCYGEFVEMEEPLEVGVDLIAGSLIKNPGGTIAPSGGYIVGKATLIDLIEDVFTVPGIGQEIGALDGTTQRLLFQGLFLAPKMVEESFYSAIYAALLFESLGYKTYPHSEESRGDVVQGILFDEDSQLIDFCQKIQSYSPVDSFVAPVPWNMPGYDHQVIMASGSFIAGSSSELSADGPLKEPYIAYLQGGVSLHYSQIALEEIARQFFKENK